MRLSSRLQVGGYWGVNTPALSFALTGPAMLAEAARTNSIVNVTAYRNKPGDRVESDSIGAYPLGLAHRRVYDTDANTKTNWIDTDNGNQFFDEFAAASPDGVPWLGHTSEERSGYTSKPAVFSIGLNGGFCVRALLHEIHRAPDENLELDVCIFSWGDATAGSRWQFQIDGSNAAMMRENTSWSQTLEDTYYVLLAIKNPTPEQEEQITQLRDQLYLDYTRISLNTDKQDAGRFYELTFIPERMGKVSVYQGDRFIDEVSDTSILKTRQAGTLWADTPVRIRRNAGHYRWQVGWPEYQTTGTLTFPYLADGTPLEPATPTLRYDAPPGTSISYEDRWVPGAKWAYHILTLTTENNRFTPFLYAAHAHLPATLRSSGGAVWSGVNVWLDTNNMGASPIKQIETRFDGECKRGQHSVELRDVRGTTFGNTTADLKYHHDTCENRRANLWVGGARIMTHGIVKSATAGPLAKTTDGVSRETITKPWTSATLVLCDQWVLLEEYELTEGELVGDGMTLGAFIKRALKLVGIGTEGGPGGINWVAGIDDGPYLPTSAIGEKWAVMNPACTLADFVTEMVEKYGLGRRLWITGEGIWTLGYRASYSGLSNPVLATVAGYAANFLSTSTLNRQSTYPGRLAMLVDIDFERNTEEFYNIIPVIGANDSSARRDVPQNNGTPAPDQPISGVWVQYDSITHTGTGIRSKKFIGRRKPMSPVVDQGLRTQSDVNRVARSLAIKYCRPPMYIGFSTYYHYGLFIGSLITCDGVLCEITRISGASVYGDRMYIMARVVG